MKTSLQEALKIDVAHVVERICAEIRKSLRTKLKKRGLIIAISGGVDSAVCAALCVKAIGAEKVQGLLLPETDSSSESLIRGEKLSLQLGIDYSVVDIGPTLKAIGCYQWRDDAIKSIFPDYDGSWKNKITIAGGQHGKLNYFNLIVQTPEGKFLEQRMGLKEYLQIVSATNFKQRIRKTLEYFHADRLNYAVVGTPNRLEFDQGFFVKNGDGAADIKPIAHLYKTQVYELAQYLQVPEEIATAKPTTDTYSLQQGQDEFYFALPYEKMDVALWAHNHCIPAKELAAFLDCTEEQAQWIYDDILAKRTTTRYLHARPQLIEPVAEIYS